MFEQIALILIQHVAERNKPLGLDFIVAPGIEPHPDKVQRFVRQLNKLSATSELRETIDVIASRSAIFYEVCLTTDKKRRHNLLRAGITGDQPRTSLPIAYDSQRGSYSHSDSIKADVRARIDFALHAVKSALKFASESKTESALEEFSQCMELVDQAAGRMGYESVSRGAQGGLDD